LDSSSYGCVWDEVAAVEIRAVRGIGVELTVMIFATQETVTVAP